MLSAITYRLSLKVYLLAAVALLGCAHATTCEVACGQTDAESTHLYFFTSVGCAPCEVVKPSIARLKASGFPTTTVDVRARPDWARHFQVSRTPTVILVHNEKMVGRREGMIDYAELASWFSTVGYSPNAAAAPKPSAQSLAPAPKSPVGTKVVLQDSLANAGSMDSKFTSPTIHQGTDQPATLAEKTAMAATVKLQVEDPEGISYATGTVIHTHGNESLVLTCGHVFRDSAGEGSITAHYGFDSPTQQSAPGELIFYDAEARDIAVVVIRTTGTPIVAAEVASKRTRIVKGNDVFSIGCDHGENPTIRHTQIKNRAAYDGAIKYDIYGRPVDGRSGGGLFTSDGRVIGVCNAAVIDVDEGIYTALDTIHWQLAKVQLDHLFDPDQALAMASTPTPRTNFGAEAAGFDASINDAWEDDQPAKPGAFPESKPMPLPATPDPSKAVARIRPEPQFPRSGSFASQAAQSGGATRPVGLSKSDNRMTDDDREVLIIVRSKDDSQPAKTISIDHPSHRLVDYLDGIQSKQKAVTKYDVAQYRSYKDDHDYRTEETESGVRRPFRDQIR